MNNLKQPLRLNYTGLAGEHRVASELLLREINIFVSRLDHGIDMILANGKKIQVKSAHTYYNKSNNGRSYRFTISNWSEERRRVKKYTVSEICDFYIMWCIEANAFFIIPCKDVEGITGINLYPDSIGVSPHGKSQFPRDRSKYSKYKERWDLLLDK